MLDDILPNVSYINIKVSTNFKPQIDGGEDFREEVMRDFHAAVFELIEKYITENDEIEGNVLEILCDNGELVGSVKEFSDLGGIAISVSECPVVVKQKNLDEDEVKLLLSNKKAVDKEQTRLR